MKQFRIGDVNGSPNPLKGNNPTNNTESVGNIPMIQTSQKTGYDITTNMGASFSNNRPTYGTEFWEKQGYDENLGNQLGAYAQQNATGHCGRCAGSVRRALQTVYRVELRPTNSNNFAEKILSSPSMKGKFKKVAVMAGVAPTDIPNGSIVIFAPDTPINENATAHKRLGFCGIMNNGSVCADGVIKDITNCTEIWIPVNE